ncbi:hypothetical protein HYALB_00001936 [Hymenoscyphus albidus]|uniref:Uncharacterized protein n=1 Tax=Hymenoscyphus albidus TaxID=595503 RepID=A0A9N9LAX0_9HELO|nr:hypothetical protein HYALB_00001936 [Hymenoscyphus albidus]
MSSDFNFTYSRETTIHAFRDYYRFLIHMFMNESKIIEPPEGGWPDISPAFKDYTGKSDSVIDLLRHLPYNDGKVESNGSPDDRWSDWQDLAKRHIGSLPFGEHRNELISRESLLAKTEPLGEYRARDDPDDQVIPSHAVGMTCGGRETWRFVLDTKLGTIHSEGWNGGDHHQRDVNDPFYVPHVCGIDGDETENELGWRESYAAWPIPDFFRLLKMKYCMLEWIPTTPHQSLPHPIR